MSRKARQNPITPQPVVYLQPAQPSSPPVPRTAFSIEEAAQSLGCGRNAVLQLIKDGRLRVVRAGRRILVPTAALDAFLTQGSGA